MEYSAIPPELAVRAYEWHRGFALSNIFILPRKQAQYLTFVKQGQAWCLRDDGDFLGLAYCISSLQNGRREWELGGLTLATSMQGKKAASTLMRLALGDALFQNNPFKRRERVITHCLKENPAPQKLFKSLKFTHVGTVPVPAELTRGIESKEPDGVVLGLEFELLEPDALEALAEWCESWEGKLSDGTPVTIILRPRTSLQDWAVAFRSMASELVAKPPEASKPRSPEKSGDRLLWPCRGDL